MENLTMKKHMGMKAKNRLVDTIIYIVLITMSIVWLIPFVFITLESFRCESTMPIGYVIPHEWGLDNYIRLFNETDFPKWFTNTLIIGLACAVLQTVITLSVSYALSRLRFKGRKLFMNLVLVLGMFPGFLGMILLYRVLSWLNLTGPNSVPGLILVYCASSGMGYYVSKGFFDTISKNIDEAAMIDGANRAQIFWQIILPLAKPIIVYTVLTSFMGPWGDYVTSSYIIGLQNRDSWTVAIGLYQFTTGQDVATSYYTQFAAGAVIVAIPITTLFLFLQKYYVSGVTGGAVKG